jgi:hypothetical protein
MTLRVIELSRYLVAEGLRASTLKFAPLSLVREDLIVADYFHSDLVRIP